MRRPNVRDAADAAMAEKLQSRTAPPSRRRWPTAAKERLAHNGKVAVTLCWRSCSWIAAVGHRRADGCKPTRRVHLGATTTMAGCAQPLFSQLWDFAAWAAVSNRYVDSCEPCLLRKRALPQPPGSVAQRAPRARVTRLPVSRGNACVCADCIAGRAGEKHPPWGSNPRPQG